MPESLSQLTPEQQQKLRQRIEEVTSGIQDRQAVASEDVELLTMLQSEFPEVSSLVFLWINDQEHYGFSEATDYVELMRLIQAEDPAIYLESRVGRAVASGLETLFLELEDLSHSQRGEQ